MGEPSSRPREGGTHRQALAEADVVNKGDGKEGVRFKKETVVNRFGS